MVRVKFQIHHFLTFSLLSAAVMCSLVSTARAAATYTYVGDNYTNAGGGSYTISMSVSGDFTFASPLASNLSNFNALPSIVSFTLTDGVQVYSETGSFAFTEFRVSTNAFGGITAWAVEFSKVPGGLPAGTGIVTCNTNPGIISAGICATDVLGSGGGIGGVGGGESLTSGLWLSPPDFGPAVSYDLLVYQEDLEGEASFPTTSEVDLIAAGGLLGGSGPELFGPPPILTGTSARESISDLTTDGTAVFFLSSTLGTDAFSLRGEFSGLSVPINTQALIQLVADFPIVPGEGDYPKIGMWVRPNAGTASDPASSSIILFETDGIPPPPPGGLDNFVELFLPAEETAALLGGAAFALDFRADRMAETATGSIQIPGFPTHTVGPMSLLFTSDTAEPIIVVQAVSFFFGASPPGAVVEVDLDAFEVYQPSAPELVPALSPVMTFLLAALLVATTWWKARSGSLEARNRG